MQQFRASLMLLVFLTSFGRCWAGHVGCEAHGHPSCPQVEDYLGSDSRDLHHDHLHHGEHHDCLSTEAHDEAQGIPLPCDEFPCHVCELNRSGFLSAGSIITVSAPVFPVTSVDRAWLNEKLGKIVGDPPAIRPEPSRSDQSFLFSIVDLVTRTSVSVRGPNLR